MANTVDPIAYAIKGDADYFESVELHVIKNSKEDGHGPSVFLVAVREGHLGCCEVIYRRCPQLLYEQKAFGVTALHEAASYGREKIIKFLLAACAKLEQKNKDIKFSLDYGLLMRVDAYRDTALHVAARKGHLQSAKLLIEAGRSNKLLTMVNLPKETAMHIAVKEHHPEIVKLLVEADPHFEYSANSSGDTPLLIALKEALSSGDQETAEIKRLLIEKQPALCRLRTEPNEWTLIHCATHKGDVSTVKDIIHSWPQSCEWVDKKGQNVLHLALRSEQINVVKYVLGLTNLAENVLMGKDVFGITPLHIALSTENHSLASVFLDHPRVKQLDRKQALDLGPIIPFECARSGEVGFFQEIHVEALRELRDGNGDSLLFISARESHFNCCEMIFKRFPELLCQTNKSGNSTLHEAALNGRDEVVKGLLSAARGKMEHQDVQDPGNGKGEEKVNKLLMLVNSNQCTALHLAVENGHFQSAKLLVEADSTKKLVTMTDDHRETAMHYAVKKHRFDFMELLVKADPDFVYSASDSGETPLLIALKEAVSRDQTTVKIRTYLIEKQASQCMVRTGDKEWTLLHYATSIHDLGAIEEIVQFCSDCLPLVDVEGHNFLHLAVHFNHENLVNYILGIPKLSDSVVNGKDNNGDTPLHLATEEGNVNIALSLLYDTRVRNMTQNKEGKSPLDAIDFVYDKSRANVQGHFGLVDVKELKDRSDFDLLVGALISTVSFTAGITVPGGFFSDGPYRGNALLYKKRTFEAFVVFNTIALALSLFAVFSHFCMRRLVSTKDIIYQLKVATISSIGAIFAMMVAFIMGSFAVLSISPGLAIAVCGICCCFFGFSFYSLWMTRMQQRRGRRRRNQQPVESLLGRVVTQICNS